MLCRTCNTHQAESGLHDCKRCAGLLVPICAHIVDAAREIASRKLHGPKLTPAEKAAPQVTIRWDASEVAHAIKRSMMGATEAVVSLPGCGELLQAEVDDVAHRLGCVVEKGTEPNTLLVVGYEGAEQ